ncbi:hypothetical protein AVEN_240538-1 [Araneus ventricosus]|uniref:Uncharacterized protein n=1 Tax=Araneus ventricosus TaxID=182803 RepID=A0A4Y2WAJ7_ARAVE|nr:hypothetical protein AVEN_240538-1 [Araneus ventricosus]
MSWQCFFILSNERPLWHFLPKEGSFITVEDLLKNEFCSLYITFEIERNFSELAISPFIFANLAARSHAQADEIRGKRRNRKTFFADKIDENPSQT